MILNNTFKQIIVITIGNLILSFGMYNIHFQNQITEGGVLGLSLLIGHWTFISAGICSIIVDLIAYSISLKHFGKVFLLKALYSSLSYGIFYMCFESIGFLLPNLEKYPLVSAISGGIFVGIGVGLVVRNGGACGGDDAIALVINKITGLKIEFVYFISDFIVLILSLSYLPFLNIFYCLITVLISAYIIGRLHIN